MIGLLLITSRLKNSMPDIGAANQEREIIINSCGYQKYTGKNKYYMMRRPSGRLDYQIIYIIYGKGNFYFNGEENPVTTVNEGSLVIYRPGEPQFYNYDYIFQPENYWIHFTGKMAVSILEDAGLSNIQIINIGINEKIIELFQKIMRELQVKNKFFDEYSCGLFLELLTYISRRILNNSGTNGCISENIQTVIEALHLNYDRKWLINEMAEMSSLSYSGFMHNFKGFTGMSPIKYLQKIRIYKACELLKDSTFNIGEIADITGFKDQYYFSRIFSQMMDCSPKEYRTKKHDER